MINAVSNVVIFEIAERKCLPFTKDTLTVLQLKAFI